MNILSQIRKSIKEGHYPHPTSGMFPKKIPSEMWISTNPNLKDFRKINTNVLKSFLTKQEVKVTSTNISYNMLKLGFIYVVLSTDPKIGKEEEITWAHVMGCTEDLKEKQAEILQMLKRSKVTKLIITSIKLDESIGKIFLHHEIEENVTRFQQTLTKTLQKIPNHAITTIDFETYLEVLNNSD